MPNDKKGVENTISIILPGPLVAKFTATVQSRSQGLEQGLEA